MSQGRIVSEHNFESMRRAMVASQLRTTAVSDPRIVAAMELVPREDFVPADRRALAYIDVQLPLGAGRALNPPMATGRLLNEAALQPTDRVLLIGAAGGYTAALLGTLVAHVTAVESDPALAASAKVALAPLTNVTVVQGSLIEGAADGAPFDVLIIDGAVEALPPALSDKVLEFGRVVSGIIENGVTRLTRGTKIGGHIRLVSFADADCAILPGFGMPKGFAF
jgi:protein-L-isoaspartate(D-aspartate) O-methyltransferase